MKHFILILGALTLVFLPLACKKDQDQSNTEQTVSDQPKPDSSPKVVREPNQTQKPADLPRFDAPVLLMAGDQPMGKGILYPSPVLYDLDGDKSPELIIGDLPGNLRIAQKLPGDDLTAWSELTKLQSADGKDIKFSNW
jgi:hypothetical protein